MPPPRGRGAKSVALTAAETLHEALFQPWTRQDATPAFRWDPAEDVRYALRADYPSCNKSTTQHGANRLAALGLAALTAVPVQRGARVGCRRWAEHSNATNSPSSGLSGEIPRALPRSGHCSAIRVWRKDNRRSRILASWRFAGRAGSVWANL